MESRLGSDFRAAAGSEPVGSGSVLYYGRLRPVSDLYASPSREVYFLPRDAEV
jgi:hypothetical protein